MAPEAGQPEKPAALKPGAPAPARKADRRTLRRPPSGRPLPEAVPPPAESGPEGHSRPPQWKRGKGGDAGAKDGGRPPGKGGSPFRDSPP